MKKEVVSLNQAKVLEEIGYNEEAGQGYSTYDGKLSSGKNYRDCIKDDLWIEAPTVTDALAWIKENFPKLHFGICPHITDIHPTPVEYTYEVYTETPQPLCLFSGGSLEYQICEYDMLNDLLTFIRRNPNQHKKSETPTYDDSFDKILQKVNN
jgi:hypothetical protein